MKAFITGSLVTLMMAGLGLFWWEGRAAVEEAAPPPDPMAFAPPAYDPEALPVSDPGDMASPAPPEASELIKEQQRFFRYDRNRDWRITRSEMLSSFSQARQ